MVIDWRIRADDVQQAAVDFIEVDSTSSGCVGKFTSLISTWSEKRRVHSVNGTKGDSPKFLNKAPRKILGIFYIDMNADATIKTMLLKITAEPCVGQCDEIRGADLLRQSLNGWDWLIGAHGLRSQALRRRASNIGILDEVKSHEIVGK